MKNRKSCIFALPELPRDAFVAFGGGIGIAVYTNTFEYDNETIEYEDVRLCTLKNEFKPNTDLIDEPIEVFEEMSDSPYIHLLFNSVDSVDAMMSALQTARESLLKKSEK